jgi:hypothetical protein
METAGIGLKFLYTFERERVAQNECKAISVAHNNDGLALLF